MNIQEIINNKRLKKKLTKEEIDFFVDGYVKNKINDYEASALLMAIAINSMDFEETCYLTNAMAKSGDILNLSCIDGVKADKHSTGGVSDTTTVIVLPILASLGIKMAKMSGRSLGFTGGTIDKLEAIPGFNTNIPFNKFIESVKNIGACIICQSKNIAPADKKIYAIRDLTSSVESLPLIASSIMSKKIACGADIICLDVKYGNGAFMKTKKDAIALANTMIKIGKNAGKKMIALITSMEEPLGNGIGCNLEIKDAVEVLNGKENNLAIVSKKICCEILMKAYNIKESEALNRVNEVIANKQAYNKLLEIVQNQGGDKRVIENLSLFKHSMFTKKITSKTSGYISKIKTEKLGDIVRKLGGGRLEAGQKIMHEVGIYLNVKIGDYVNIKSPLCSCFYNTQNANKILNEIYDCFEFSPKKVFSKPKLIAKILK